MMKLLEEKYEILDTLGQGNISMVLKIKEKSSEKEYACKAIYIKDLSEEEILGIEKEINILIQLECKYSVNLKESFKDEKYYYMILELCDDNLFTATKRSRENFSTEKIKKI